jgi:serine/threonine protein kinase
MSLALEIDTLVKHYRIKSLLGEGGCGRTYLAENTWKFGEVCVLKEFVPPNRASHKKVQELFEREAKLLCEIEHPQIPKFHGYFQFEHQDNQLLMIVQDYVKGKTYQALYDQGLHFQEAEAIVFLRSVLPVLAYIHAKGIIHRDIAPDNLMWSETQQRIYLIDFGVARDTRLQPGNTAPHKLGYTPLEQMMGKACFASDLHALGVTTLVLLGIPLDYFQSISEVQDRSAWRQLFRISPVFAHILEKLVAERVTDRFQSAQSVLDALNGVNVSPIESQRHPMSELKTVVVAPAYQPPQVSPTVPSYVPADPTVAARPSVTEMPPEPQDPRYVKLETLLKAEKWKEADHETYCLLQMIVGEDEEIWFDDDDPDNLPCTDLLRIDQLWVQASNGYFGFSVQKKIWDECGSPLSIGKSWDHFCVKVGWKNSATQYISYDDLKKIPSVSPLGELPCHVFYLLGNRLCDGHNAWAISLFRRAATCEI